MIVYKIGVACTERLKNTIRFWFYIAEYEIKSGRASFREIKRRTQW